MTALTNEMRIHADRSHVALVHGAQLPWIRSPEQGIERRMLERVGDEVAMATTIVRYQSQSSFPSHTHELGEEFMVLEGTFSDEHGDYPAGTYVRNPPRSTHAPYSANGCTIFVKLRQMHADEDAHVVIYPDERFWQKDGVYGYERAVLYGNERIGVELLRLHVGCKFPKHEAPEGGELFVIEGRITLADDECSTLDKWSWLRHPGANPSLLCNTDSLLWIKRGHLKSVESVE